MCVCVCVCTNDKQVGSHAFGDSDERRRPLLSGWEQEEQESLIQHAATPSYATAASVLCVQRRCALLMVR